MKASYTGRRARFLATCSAPVLAGLLAVALPTASLAASSEADPTVVLAQAKGDCADAKAHFDIAKEIGTREALQIHVDAYGDCTFAPFARILMGTLPGGTPARGDARPAAPSAEAQADIFLARLGEVPALMAAEAGATFAYERAEASGDDIKIHGLQLVGKASASPQTRIRFAETLLVRPVATATGTLSAERIELTGGETSERNTGAPGTAEGEWTPALNPDGFGVAVDRIVLMEPGFLAPADRSEEALGSILRLKAVEFEGFRFTREDEPFFSLARLSAGFDAVSDALPHAVTLKIDGASVTKAGLADMMGTAGDGDDPSPLDQLGYDEFTYSLDTTFKADPDASTLGFEKFYLAMEGGFSTSMEVKLSGVTLAGLADSLTRGPTPGGMEESVALDFGTIAYSDRGLVPRLFSLTATQTGVEESALKAVLPGEARKAALGLLADEAVADAILRATAEFLTKPGLLALTLSPDAPVALSKYLGQEMTPEDTQELLRSARATLTVNELPPIALFGQAEEVATLAPDTRAAIEACDSLAADSDDTTKRAPGIKSPSDIDAEKAIPACEKAQAAAPDDPLIAFQLGRAYAAADRAEDSARLYADASARGHPIASYELARLKLDGTGTAKDPAAAIALFESIADTVPQARATLASLYYNGTGVPADTAKAIALWQEGADKGEADSEYNLGVEYILGTAVPADPAKATEMLTRAAEKGHADAMAELGKVYFRAEAAAASPDYSAAYTWLARAAEAGSVIGMSNAGYMLALGLGTGEPDPAKAADWLLQALAKGDPDSAAYLIDDKGKRFDKAFRKQIQEAMRARGSFDGAPSGVFAAGTIKALKSIRDGKG